MSKQRSPKNADPPADSTDSSGGGRSKRPASKEFRALWQAGALFHATSRYPRKRGAPKVDRLAGILKSGLLAPASSRDGTVFSDLNILVTGLSLAYDSLVFLHRFGDQSAIYTICDPGRFFVFVDPTIPVLTPEAMGTHWPELCMDEVYVRDGVGLDKLIGIVVHPADADSVLNELRDDFGRAGVPLFDYDGNVLLATPS